MSETSPKAKGEKFAFGVVGRTFGAPDLWLSTTLMVDFSPTVGFFIEFINKINALLKYLILFLFSFFFFYPFFVLQNIFSGCAV